MSNQNFLYNACTWQLQLLLYFVLYCEFLSLPLREYTYRVNKKILTGDFYGFDSNASRYSRMDQVKFVEDSL